MKNKVLLLLIILVTAIGIMIPLFKFFFISVTRDLYEDVYRTKYTSLDGHVSFICDNKKGLIGVGRYTGKYIDDSGQMYDIELVVDKTCYACINDDIDHPVFWGKGNYNLYTNLLTVNIEKAEFETTVYRSGDKIIFKKSE